MKKTSDLVMHPLWIIPVMLLSTMILIETLHTVTHWRMEIDANAYCRNNAEWINDNQN
tara:strand:- start:401 stop:574 length:174 start_codon:yes stop_codon:yes gene_type:complete